MIKEHSGGVITWVDDKHNHKSSIPNHTSPPRHVLDRLRQQADAFTVLFLGRDAEAQADLVFGDGACRVGGVAVVAGDVEHAQLDGPFE